MYMLYIPDENIINLENHSAGMASQVYSGFFEYLRQLDQEEESKNEHDHQ
ncbi:hypothetical protein SAMN05443252_102413 [Bacillus sp. OV322]|nr:hypothetical protein [Bacillus sp. OV322]SFC25267.1 hypothetical protein SAMN05443252_102413 [Bacillus sp. OV322]